MRNKIIRFHALLGELKLRSQKEAMLSGYGAESTKELTSQQLDGLISRLEGIKASKRAAIDDAIRKKRSIILTLLQQMGIYADNNDWTRVNSYLLEPKVCGKLLYELDIDELNTLDKKLRSIKRKEELKKQQTDYLSANN